MGGMYVDDSFCSFSPLSLFPHLFFLTLTRLFSSTIDVLTLFFFMFSLVHPRHASFPDSAEMDGAEPERRDGEERDQVEVCECESKGVCGIGWKQGMANEVVARRVKVFLSPITSLKRIFFHAAACCCVVVVSATILLPLGK